MKNAFLCSFAPSIRREWIEMENAGFERKRTKSLPPYGGSGLKCLDVVAIDTALGSPSIRREWIEIQGQT